MTAAVPCSPFSTDAEGGINSFIEQQKQEPGEANVTLVQFDTEYEFVHSGVPIRQVPAFKLVPRGSTALLDAVGRAINETGARLAAMDESQRPGLVVFVIVTDGEENSSREFTRDQIRKMVEHQQSAYKWQFTFLAANQDAFAAGGSMGIAQDGIAAFSPGKVRGTYAAAAQEDVPHAEGRQRRCGCGQQVHRRRTWRNAVTVIARQSLSEARLCAKTAGLFLCFSQ